MVAAAVETTVEAEVAVNKPHQSLRHSLVRSIRVQSILISHLVSGGGALCISGGGGGLISVPNPPPARGRTSSLPKLPTNETGTSPEIQWIIL